MIPFIVRPFSDEVIAVPFNSDAIVAQFIQRLRSNLLISKCYIS